MHEQVIYFGAPGTGKSYYVKQKLEGISENKIFRTTIHPEYSYSDFIGQLLPENTGNGGVDFKFREGVFTRALVEAYLDSSKDVFLVLEELSRGNVSAIFGDIFQLLDRDEHFVSRYPINNKNVAERIKTIRSSDIVLPSNFNILCTVNMNDQNVFPMDTAFKRRFDWEYIPTTPAIDEDTGIIDSKLNNPKVFIHQDDTQNNYIETTWQSFYSALNLFITNKSKGLGRGEDKQIGQFFIDFSKDTIVKSHSSDKDEIQESKKTVNALIKNKLLLFLWQDVQGASNLFGGKTLFNDSINTFADLFEGFDKYNVFSGSFINEFLIPNKDKYQY